jgi:hypothetical protein
MFEHVQESYTTRRFALVICVFLLLVGAQGCKRIADRVVDRVAEIEFERAAASRLAKRDIVRELEFRRGDKRRFKNCLSSEEGVCDVEKAIIDPGPLTTAVVVKEGKKSDENLDGVEGAAVLAANALNHTVQGKLNDVYNYLAGRNPGTLKNLDWSTDSPGLKLSLEEVDEYEQAIEAATLVDGWGALASVGSTLLEDFGDDDKRRLRYIQAYLRAYFRDGKFYQATMDTDKLKKKIAARLKKQIPVPGGSVDFDKLAEQVVERLQLVDAPNGKKKLFGKIGTTGFVTRGGKQYQFPAIEATIDPVADRKVSLTSVDVVAVGSDLIRVVLHAIFDAHDRLPALGNATGLKIEDVNPLPVHDPGKSKVDAAEFERVESRANQLEGVTAAATGRLIRGLSWFSLNNEALATALETAAGVATRKFGEKAMWCWYSCELNVKDDGKGNVTKVPEHEALASGDRVKLRIVIESPPAVVAQGGR